MMNVVNVVNHLEPLGIIVPKSEVEGKHGQEGTNL